MASLSIPPLRLGFIGGGNMATAMITGLLAKGHRSDHIRVANPSSDKLQSLHRRFLIETTQNNQQLASWADWLILAIKPQKMSEVCQQLSSVLLKDKLVISIAAGCTIESMQQQLRQPIKLVRAMPNTPSQIGQGATGLFSRALLSEVEQSSVEFVFNAIGQLAWVKQESDLDIVTAIAGSLPAFVYYFLQSVVETAEKSGLDQKTAKALAAQAVSGAAQLVLADNSNNLTQLRQAVTSPGGTTEAGLDCLKQNQFYQVVQQAINSAINKAKTLGQEN